MGMSKLPTLHHRILTYVFPLVRQPLLCPYCHLPALFFPHVATVDFPLLHSHITSPTAMTCNKYLKPFPYVHSSFIDSFLILTSIQFIGLR